MLEEIFLSAHKKPIKFMGFYSHLLTLVHMVNLLIEVVCTRTVICTSSGVTFLSLMMMTKKPSENILWYIQSLAQNVYNGRQYQ